jgi:DNA-binding NtrC family response regulator
VPTVVIGEFGEVARLGLQRFLTDEGFDVVTGSRSIDLVDDVTAAEADAVVLDLDSADAEPLARRITERHPKVRVVGCSSRRPTMIVFSGSPGRAREVRLTRVDLAEALKR